MPWISEVPDELIASQEGPCSKELVICVYKGDTVKSKHQHTRTRWAAERAGGRGRRPAWQRQTGHQSALKGGIAKVGWTVLPHPPSSSHLASSDLHPFGARKYALRGRRFANEDQLTHNLREEFWRCSKEFYMSGSQRLTQRFEKCVDNEGDFMEKYLIFGRRYPWFIYICKFNFNCNFSFWAKITDITFEPPLVLVCHHLWPVWLCYIFSYYHLNDAT
jgi:hypothetical protein